MESTTVNQIEEKEPELSQEAQAAIVSSELALIPEEDRKEIAKIVKTADVILIDSHKKKLKSFKAKFPAKKYVITDDLVFDKEVYEKALEQWREVKNYRTKNVEPDFKKLKAPYVAITKFYNEQTAPVIADYKAIEKPISDFVDKLEALEKIEKEKEAIALKKRTDDRVDTLIKAGMSFDGEYYSIGSEEFKVPQISLGMVDIQTMTDGIFENILQQATDKAAIIADETQKKAAADLKLKQEADAEAERVRIQAKADQEKLEADKLALENEKLEMQKLRIESRSEVLENMDFKKDADGTYIYGNVFISENYMGETTPADWTTFITKLRQEIKERKDADVKRLEEEKLQNERTNRINARYDQLFALGMKFNGQYGCYMYEDVNVDNATEINLFNEDEWNALIAKITPAIAERKAIAKEIEKRTSERIAYLKLLDPSLQYDAVNELYFIHNPAISAGLELSVIKKMKPENWEALVIKWTTAIETKAQSDKKAQEELDEKSRIETLAKAGDKAVWSDFVSRLNAIAYPEVTSQEYKDKVAKVKAYHEGLK
jgi:hypothetical protein